MSPRCSGTHPRPGSAAAKRAPADAARCASDAGRGAADAGRCAADAGQCAADADRGSATVLAAVCGVVLLLIAGLAAHLGAATLARQRAETGADLAALAGAARVLRGADAACAAAGRVARANEARLDGCAVDGPDLLVEVSAEVAGGALFGGSATGRARAGPVESVGVAR